MGISLEAYRATIGMHAMRAVREPKVSRPEVMSDVRVVTAACIMGIMIGLISGQVIALALKWHCIISLCGALCGEHIAGSTLVSNLKWSYCQSAATMTMSEQGLPYCYNELLNMPSYQYTFDSSFLLLLSGTVG